MSNNIPSEITFEIDATPNQIQANRVTSVLIMRNGNKIGRVWSESKDGSHPFPHSNDSYCLNSVQICGFDKISETWACGPFAGHKDCVVYFRPDDNEYFSYKMGEYAEYVKNFATGKKPMNQLKNFQDWLGTNI